MAIYEVFSHPIEVKYKTTICSKSTFFNLTLTVFTYVLPIILIYYTPDFWRKSDYYREQPQVAFKHKLLLVLETKNPNEIIFWSTYEGLNQLISDEIQSLVPAIEHQEKDINNDGVKDELQMILKVPLMQQDILSIKLLLIFDYRLDLYSFFEMESAAFIHQSSSLPASSVHIFGDLYLTQKEALLYSGRDQKYNTPVVDDSRKDMTLLQLENILLSYMLRNVTTSLQNIYSVWKTGRSPGESIDIILNISYPEQTILYKPSFWQQLKWCIVQYISFFVICSYVFYRIKRYLFQRHILPAIVISPSKRVS